ncbi:MAG: CocE/NonD family hydrolase [Verrucomicrobia bacterium]|nr:CocE/NonD family hydrolase [Verrucomicrobiota bacterium]
MAMRHLLLVSALLASGLPAQTDPAMADGIPRYERVRPQADYERREVKIPMRDGAKLYTVIVFRKGTKNAPILLSRTPYDAARTTWRNSSQRIEEILPIADAEFVQDGYIRVYQDVRGLHKSEGEYLMARPLVGSLNRSKVDHSTDAYDTIEWLVKNVPEGNGRVGICGSSYLGFTSLMALVRPHPALKAAVPQSPMVDGWLGDDWFHNGAYRQINFDYITEQNAKEGSGPVSKGTGDDYAVFLREGSAGAYARAFGLLDFPAARKVLEHPAYDAYWEGQALDKILAREPLTVPTMLVVGQWDQEDSYGAPAVYRAWKPKDPGGMLGLVIGPWRHSGFNREGASLGPLDFEGDTALQFRTRWMKPFLDHHLKPGAPAFRLPASVTYATGTNRWEVRDAWPAGKPKALYLQAGGALAWTPPTEAGRDEYVSDPAKPVPFVPRPVNMRDSAMWGSWLLSDQRNVSTRPDVLSWATPVLEKAVQIAGAPEVDLWAATSGTDSDWVVKVIDVYPLEMSNPAKLAGYELPIGIEIYRGRYVRGFATPGPLQPGKAENYRFALPNVNHVFQPGHRIMVQIQSTLFPLYDRNPQTFVPNIFHARPEDYRAATQTILRTPGQASAVRLPVVSD